MEWPSCTLISGPSGCGKSELVFRILENVDNVYTKHPGVVIFCYNEYQSGYERFACNQKFIFVQGLPDIEMLKSYKNQRPLLILDDLMVQLDKWSESEKLFSVLSHHFDMSVIAIIHSIFYSKTMRNLRMHSSYLILFKNNPDRLTIRNLATQLFPTNRKYFIDAFEDATREPHSYLLCDLHKNTPEKFKLRTSLFPSDIIYCYLPK